ncbi:hypothetical protein ANCDUO_05051 [Ancylostoma duodenale]|uniref:Calpain catalytic domain-containing protein n=1 Tax=Ancylostoma duodenale TaxID=51022 RepID=A0A0C2DPP1_9BILA|nr:hypothetical protein ANCDUO_05051 [Ancylostoma duodenale]
MEATVGVTYTLVACKPDEWLRTLPLEEQGGAKKGARNGSGLYGSYENLDGGGTAEALEDFTGGLTESYDLRKENKLFILAMLIRGFEMGSLFACAIDVSATTHLICLHRKAL